MFRGEIFYTTLAKRLAKRKGEIRENKKTLRRRGLASVAGETESHVSGTQLLILSHSLPVPYNLLCLHGNVYPASHLALCAA